MTRRTALALATLLAILLAACGDPPVCRVGDTSSSGEDFENCTGDGGGRERRVCGKRLLAGEARIAPTWHPGEHGLFVEAGARVILVSPYTSWESRRTVSFLASCDAEAELFFRGWEVPVRDDPVARRYGPFDVLSASSPSDDRENTLSVVGSGECWVDQVHVETTVIGCPAPFDAGTDGGAMDPGPPDAGPLDAGPADAGAPDAAPFDASASDAGAMDASVGDAGRGETVAPDGSAPDGSAPEDAASAEGGTAVTDAG